MAGWLAACGPVLSKDALDARGETPSSETSDTTTTTKAPTTGNTAQGANPNGVTVITSHPGNGNSTSSTPTNPNTAPTTPPAPMATGLKLTIASTTVEVDSMFSLQATAIDANGAIVANFDGNITISSSDPSSPAQLTQKAANGVTTFENLMFTAVGSQTLSVTSGSTSPTVVHMQVQPGPMSSLNIIIPASVLYSASSADILVTAYDAHGNIASGFLGQVSFSETSNGGALSGDLPAPYTFQSSDHGSKLFSGGFGVPASFPGQQYTVTVISGDVQASSVVTIVQ